MHVWKKMLVHAAWGGLFMAALPGAIVPAVAQDATGAVARPSQASQAETPAIGELPDSPGALTSSSTERAMPRSEASEPRWELALAVPQTAPASAQSQTQSSAAPAQTAGQKPVGTAAAEAPNSTGIAASQPAGVAVAPAKQRRVRTIIIRTGALIGAAVAVGAVVALSAGTSSKPPGAH
jgi:hypothetical protein